MNKSLISQEVNLLTQLAQEESINSEEKETRTNSQKKGQKKYHLPRPLKQILTNGTESEEVGNE